MVMAAIFFSADVSPVRIEGNKQRETMGRADFLWLAHYMDKLSSWQLKICVDPGASSVGESLRHF